MSDERSAIGVLIGARSVAGWGLTLLAAQGLRRWGLRVAMLRLVAGCRLLVAGALGASEGETSL